MSNAEPPGPGAGGEPERMPPSANVRWLQFLDLVLSVAVLTAVVFALAVLVGLALAGDPLGTAKVLLFPVGFVLLGIGALELRPTSAWRDKPVFTIEPDEETRLQRFVMELPPLRGHHLPFESRVSRGAKLFVTGFLSLVISFTMEVVLGIGAA